MQDIFRFKHFSVKQSNELMKVGTDGVILAAYINCENAEHILDVGTGTGIMALMMAQKSQAFIHAIDINEKAINLAKYNFKNSNWANRIEAYCVSFQKFKSKIKYDIIVSNPPYFFNGNPSINNGKAIAKHDVELQLKDLLINIKRLLKIEGRAFVIYPAIQEPYFVDKSIEAGLFISTKLFISPKIDSKPKRIIFELSNKPSNCFNKFLSIENHARHDYSDDYRELTKDFYLKF